MPDTDTGDENPNRVSPLRHPHVISLTRVGDPDVEYNLCHHTRDKGRGGKDGRLGGTSNTQDYLHPFRHRMAAVCSHGPSSPSSRHLSRIPTSPSSFTSPRFVGLYSRYRRSWNRQNEQHQDHRPSPRSFIIHELFIHS